MKASIFFIKRVFDSLCFRHISINKIEVFSTLLILASTIQVILEMYDLEHPFWSHFIESALISLFTYEMLIRWSKWSLSRKAIVLSHVAKQIYYQNTSVEKRWLLFDTSIVVASMVTSIVIRWDYVAFILIARLVRIFRLLRLFSIHRELKIIPHRIFLALKTISIFLILMLLMLFLYASLGVFIFEKTNFGVMDFSSLHAGMFSLFNVLFDGFIEGYQEIKNQVLVSPIIAKGYMLSYALLMLVIFINVLIAVMTNQVWERVITDKNLSLKEEIRDGDQQIQTKLDYLISQNR